VNATALVSKAGGRCGGREPLNEQSSNLLHDHRAPWWVYVENLCYINFFNLFTARIKLTLEQFFTINENNL